MKFHFLGHASNSFCSHRTHHVNGCTPIYRTNGASIGFLLTTDPLDAAAPTSKKRTCTGWTWLNASGYILNPVCNRILPSFEGLNSNIASFLETQFSWRRLWKNVPYQFFQSQILRKLSLSKRLLRLFPRNGTPDLYLKRYLLASYALSYLHLTR